jgi:hypothetical protein
MITRTVEPNHFEQQAQLIKDQVATVLAKWGLLSRFSRWRLTRDPDTGMVVLFGILNSKYIATHTSIPFSDYFDPRLLHDLANELQVQVVSCNSDGLRYAFILDRAQFEKLPTHIDFPFVEQGKLFARVVYNDILQPLPPSPSPVNAPIVEDLTFLRQMTAAFLKVFDDIKIQDDLALQLAAQNPPAILLINQEEFNKRVAEHEVNRQRVKRIGRLLENDTG